MTLTSTQIREARQLLGWSRTDLACNTFLPLAVIEVVEDHGSTSMLPPGQMAAIRDVFTSAGIEIIPENGSGAGVGLRKEAS